MPTCSQAKIITNLESDIHKRFFKLSNDSSQNFQQQCGDPFLNNESNECFYSIANKVNQVECIELHTNNTTNHPSHPNHNNNSITYTSNNKSHNQNQNQFYTEYCKSNSTLTKSANQPSRSTSYYTQNYLNQFVNQQRKQKKPSSTIWFRRPKPIISINSSICNSNMPLLPNCPPPPPTTD